MFQNEWDEYSLHYLINEICYNNEWLGTCRKTLQVSW